MASLLDLLGLGATATARQGTARMEGEQIRQQRESADLMARLAQDRQAEQDAMDREMFDLRKRDLLSEIDARSAPKPLPVPRRQVVDGQIVDLDAAVARPIQGYQAPAPKPTASPTPARGTPAYITMLEQEAAARAKGGGAERGAQLPAAAIERMIELDDLIGMTKRARQSLGSAVAEGRNVTGRAGGVLPIPNWIRNTVGQGGDVGTGVRAELANITSSLIKLRSGAAVTTQEFSRLEPFLASDDDDESVAMIKLRKLNEALDDIKRIRLENYQKYGKLGTREGTPNTVTPDDLDALINAELGRTP